MEFPGGSINSQSCEADFNHVDSPCSYKRLIFILHETSRNARRDNHLRKTCMGTKSKDTLGGIYLGNKDYMAEQLSYPLIYLNDDWFTLNSDLDDNIVYVACLWD